MVLGVVYSVRSRVLHTRSTVPGISYLPLGSLSLGDTLRNHCFFYSSYPLRNPAPQGWTVTPAELAFAKDSVLNSFVSILKTPNSVAVRYEYYGYPADFLFRYQRGVKATTATDVQRVAQTYLKPESLWHWWWECCLNQPADQTASRSDADRHHYSRQNRWFPIQSKAWASNLGIITALIAIH